MGLFCFETRIIYRLYVYSLVLFFLYLVTHIPLQKEQKMGNAKAFKPSPTPNLSRNHSVAGSLSLSPSETPTLA